jgi:hypothetical protein
VKPFKQPHFLPKFRKCSYRGCPPSLNNGNTNRSGDEKMGRMKKGLKEAIKFIVGNGYYTVDNVERSTIEENYGYVESMCWVFDVEQLKMTEEEWTQWKNEMWDLLQDAQQWILEKGLI